MTILSQFYGVIDIDQARAEELWNVMARNGQNDISSSDVEELLDLLYDEANENVKLSHSDVLKNLKVLYYVGFSSSSVYELSQEDVKRIIEENITEGQKEMINIIESFLEDLQVQTLPRVALDELISKYEEVNFILQRSSYSPAED